MSLSTLLEAAKYLDYLDSNNQQHQQMQLDPVKTSPSQQNQQAGKQRSSSRRQRISKRNAANTIVAMSLPNSTNPAQMYGVPIPFASDQTTSLSSSFNTGSPLSSFASTALFCSKTSEVASASSSAASSLSSSDSSSLCGEILMGDTDFNPSNDINILPSSTSKRGKRKGVSKQNSVINNNHHNYYIDGQKIAGSPLFAGETSHPAGAGDRSGTSMYKFSSSSGSSGIGSMPNSKSQSVARYIAATSSGPQLVTMSAEMASSAPVSGGILRAGHVIHAAANHGTLMGSPGGSFEAHGGQFVMATDAGHHHYQRQSNGDGAGCGVGSSMGSDSHLSSGAGSCQPMIMTRVQPMILNPVMSYHHHNQQPSGLPSPSPSSSYSRHRELHKTLEKNRRAHLRHCFEILKAELPSSECADKKTSHINIIKSAIRYVLALRQQEGEIESERQRLIQAKKELTESLSRMRICPMLDDESSVIVSDVKVSCNDRSSCIDNEKATDSNNRQLAQQSTMRQQHQIRGTSSPSALSSSTSNQQHDSNLEQQQLLMQQHQKAQNQPPAAEQQLSFLLSQSKID